MIVFYQTTHGDIKLSLITDYFRADILLINLNITILSFNWFKFKGTLLKQSYKWCGLLEPNPKHGQNIFN